jgi:two-component system NtrC family sensor kinase
MYKGRPVGTVTIFQHDLRVSTNVVKADGTRAVGTRLSDVVYQRVLEEGGIWADRAFVVNDWYITAYEPIYDPTGRIIGALYVGLLEAPFVDQQRLIIGVFLAMVTVTTLTSLALLFFVTKLVLRPIGQVVTMSQKVVEGDLSARVGIRPPGEMGALCRAVDAMADAVDQREEQLKLAARKQIGQSEKLASIGRLAAGIAHEINNPLTGVLTFAHLLRQKGNMSAEDQQDLDLIISETSRVAEIVRGLLDFARERPSEKKPVDINHVIRQTLRLVSGQKLFTDIVVEERLDENLPRITGDENQLQQVILNLTLNASEAMPDGGTLTLTTCAKDGKVRVTVADTGCGIPREHLEDIFEPFYSTKPVGKGTGLGLSVSYGIIQQHGGSLEVESEEGRGTAVTIILPPSGGRSGPAGETRVSES